MLQDSRKIYKRISDRKVSDTIKYLAFKYKLEESHIKEIVLERQFLYARGRMSSGYWRSVKIVGFGTFRFNKKLFDRHFQRVCKQSEERHQKIQDILIKDDKDNASK